MVSTECRRDEHDADEGMPQMSLAQFAEDVHDELEPPETQKSPKKGRAQHLDSHKTAQFVMKKIDSEIHCDAQV
ncbi:ORC2-like protein [Alternaria alternata]|nr:ORC2-like protein [Alternaria alternata]